MRYDIYIYMYVVRRQSVNVRTEYNGDYVKPRKNDLECGKDATSDDDCCNEVDA